jgi:hypothetical protein
MTSFSDSLTTTANHSISDGPGGITTDGYTAIDFRIRFSDLPTITVVHTNAMPVPTLGAQSHQVAALTLLLKNSSGAVVSGLSRSKAGSARDYNFSPTPPYHNVQEYNTNQTLITHTKILSYDIGTGETMIEISENDRNGPFIFVFSTNVNDCYSIQLSHSVIATARAIDFAGTGEPWDTYRSPCSSTVTSSVVLTVT